MGIDKYKREYFKGDIPFTKWIISDSRSKLPLTIFIFLSMILINYINLILSFILNLLEYHLLISISHSIIIFLVSHSMYFLSNKKLERVSKRYKIFMDSIIFTIHIYSLYLFSNLIFILFGSLFINMYIGLGVVLISYLLLSFYITYLDYIDWLVKYKPVGKDIIREIRLNEILK